MLWFLELNLLGGDVRSRGVRIVLLCGPILGEISGLREILIDLEVNFPLGAGVPLRLVDSVFKVELFFAFEEFKDGLITVDRVSIHRSFACRITHNDINLIIFNDKSIEIK